MDTTLDNLNIEKYMYEKVGESYLIKADCLEWMQGIQENTIHGIVTDPPYGFKEFELKEIQKLNTGKGGVWRLPPNFDGSLRSPVPRFTALTKKERDDIALYYSVWGKEALRITRPGGHLIIASNAHISPILFNSLITAGWEFRTEIIRTIETLRGGDRPKNAENEFPDVTVLPKGKFEPWGLFRKPLPPKTTVAECLRKYQTGALRRISDNKPFGDLIISEKTPKNERLITKHLNTKPQSLMRQLVKAVLPLEEGLILDPFSGSGSTVAAAEAMGLKAIGIERYPDYFANSMNSVYKLANLEIEIEELGLTGKDIPVQMKINFGE